MSDVATYLGDKAHWRGSDGFTHLLYEHVWISIVAMLIATAIALPVGLTLGHLRRGEVVAVNIA
ncbi:MAG TPA: hypothetical protein VEA78_05350, partial [Acidimicrobiales bacterium]|nr:hypothetical protein [Acidimicrobiales bacterium]